MLIKRIVRFITIIAVLIIAAGFSCSAVSISAESFVVLDARTNEIVFESNAHEKRSMASTTKIMTAILAIESGRLKETVDVTAAMTRAEGTSIGLKAGYRLSLLDLVYGMMLESGNDAANAVALYLEESFEAFSALMNKKAFEIGMRNTNFVTPSGLDDEKHYSTAYDMALLASYCVKNPVFKSVCSKKNYVAELLSPISCRLYFSNHNRLLSSVDGVFGVKTGFTKKSGRCLVSAIEKNGATFVAVTLKAPDDWNDHRKLFSLCFERYEAVETKPGIPSSVKIIGAVKSSLALSPEKESVVIGVKKGEKITQKAYLSPFVYAPVKTGDVLGRVDFFCGGKKVDSVALCAAESIQSQEETYILKKSFIEILTEKLKSFFN